MYSNFAVFVDLMQPGFSLKLQGLSHLSLFPSVRELEILRNTLCFLWYLSGDKWLPTSFYLNSNRTSMSEPIFPCWG